MSSDPVPSLEEIYDDEVLALIEHYTRCPGAARQVSVAEVVEPGTATVAPVPWMGDSDDPEDDGDDVGSARASTIRPTRWSLGGAMMAGAMLGVAEVLEPDRAKQTIIEFAPDSLDEDQQLVTFVYVAGDPRASRLIIRPWLLTAPLPAASSLDR